MRRIGIDGIGDTFKQRCMKACRMADQGIERWAIAERLGVRRTHLNVMLTIGRKLLQGGPEDAPPKKQK